MQVYLAGSISNLLPGQALGWRSAVTERLLAAGFVVADPLRGAEHNPRRKIRPDTYDTPVLGDKAIVRRDMLDVLTSDIILANLLKAKTVSIGTMFELAWAVAFNKLAVIVLDSKNLHLHPFTRESGVIFRDLDEAVEFVIASRPRVPNAVKPS